MNNILTYISISDGKIRRSSLELLSRCSKIARESGYTSAALIIDENAGNYLEQIKTCGPSKIYTVEDSGLQKHLNAPLLNALTSVIAQVKPGIMAFASTEESKDLLGALAARLKASSLPDLSEFEILENGVRGKRPVMASKILSVVEAGGKPVILSVRSGSYDLIESTVEPEIEKINVSQEPGRVKETGGGVKLKELIRSSGDQIDLSEADTIIAAGRGVRDEEGVQLISDLAAVLNAGIGASRALTESGVYDPALQIGQTGKVVSPALYIAVGISGAVQHVAGITNSRYIVAINKDPDAPIFDIADYGLVGDLYKILPPFIEEIKRLKSQ